MEYDSASKKNEILSFVITWINLEDIILKEISQAQKNLYIILTYMWNLKTQTGRSRMVVSRGKGWECGQRKGKCCSMATKFQSEE
jgi:hypothetical protein